jgi:hypothetical protein
VLAGFAVICLGHESHTGRQSCGWSQPGRERLSLEGKICRKPVLGVFSPQQVAHEFGP